MFVVKRNQVIITALVVMIAVAGYLNYMDGQQNGREAISLNDQGEISALVPELDGQENMEAESIGEIGTALTMDDNPAIAITDVEAELASDANLSDANLSDANLSDEGQTLAEPGEAVFVNTSIDSSYFVQAKLERENARAKEKDILMELINNNNIEQSKKADSADAMMEIQKRIEKETAAEAMIEAKGFNEVYVRISEDSVDVVVNKEALSDAETAQIEDIVKRKTGMSVEQIHISPMRK